MVAVSNVNPRNYGTGSAFWSDRNLALFAEAYSSGGMNAVCGVFPDVTVTSLRNVATKHKFRVATRKQRTRGSSDAAVAGAPLARRTARERLNDKIERSKAVIAETQARIDSLAAKEAARAAARVTAEANRKTAKLERAYAASIERVESLRLEIVAIKPDFKSSVVSAGSPEAREELPIVPVTPGPLKEKLLRGDREFIRRRMVNFVVPSIVGELRARGSDVVNAIGEMAQNGFAPEADWHVDAADAWASTGAAAAPKSSKSSPNRKR